MKIRNILMFIFTIIGSINPLLANSVVYSVGEKCWSKLSAGENSEAIKIEIIHDNAIQNDSLDNAIEISKCTGVANKFENDKASPIGKIHKFEMSFNEHSCDLLASFSTVRELYFWANKLGHKQKKQNVIEGSAVVGISTVLGLVGGFVWGSLSSRAKINKVIDLNHKAIPGSKEQLDSYNLANKMLKDRAAGKAGASQRYKEAAGAAIGFGLGYAYDPKAIDKMGESSFLGGYANAVNHKYVELVAPTHLVSGYYLSSVPVTSGEIGGLDLQNDLGIAFNLEDSTNYRRAVVTSEGKTVERQKRIINGELIRMNLLVTQYENLMNEFVNELN